MLTLYECNASTSEYSFHANIGDDIDDDQVSVSVPVGLFRFDGQIVAQIKIIFVNGFLQYGFTK